MTSSSQPASRDWHIRAHPTSAWPRAAASGAGSPPGCARIFLIPFVLTDLISINRDLYYGIYIGAVFGFVGAWLRFGIDVAARVLTHNWRSGIAIGLALRRA